MWAKQFAVIRMTPKGSKGCLLHPINLSCQPAGYMMIYLVHMTLSITMYHLQEGPIGQRSLYGTVICSYFFL
jgi:hypothetical protein